jgi:thioredoxin reductase
MHGFLTRDGIDPQELRQIARNELARYPGVQLRRGRITRVERRPDGLFSVHLPRKRTAVARKLLIATGVMDVLPPLAGIERFWGHSVHQCPYCDGWEIRNAAVAVYGKRHRAMEMARAMTAWTSDIVICSNGASGLDPSQRKALARNGIRINEKRISTLAGEGTRLRELVFTDGTRLARSALFFDMPTRPQADLAQQLGCSLTSDGGIRSGRYEATDVPGVFVAGNITKDVQLSIVAAAEGTRAAFGINQSLTREDFTRRATGTRRIQHPAAHPVEHE